jgi:hypothetical protein
MTFLTNGAGFSITGSKIFFAEKTFEEKRLTITRFLSIDSADEITTSISEIKLASMLEEALEKDGAPISKEISVTFPLGFYHSFFYPVDKKLSLDEIKDQSFWELEQLIPSIDSSKFLSSFFVSEVNGTNYANAFAIPKNVIEILQKFAIRKDVSIKYIDHPAISAANAFRSLIGAELREKPLLYFYLEGNQFSAILLEADGIVRLITKTFDNDNLLSLLKAVTGELKEISNSPEGDFVFGKGGNVGNEDLENQLVEEFNFVPLNYLERFTGIEVTVEESENYAPILGAFLRVR